VAEGGFLYDRIYLDLHKNSPCTFSSRGITTYPRAPPISTGFKFVVKDLLSLEAEGQITDAMLQRPCRLHLRLPQTATQKLLLSSSSKDPSGREKCRSSQQLTWEETSWPRWIPKGDEGWRVLGRCSWRDAKSSGKRGFGESEGD